MKTKRIGKTVGLLGLALMLAAAGCAGAAGSEKESNEATVSQGAGESNEATGSQGAGEGNEATGSQRAGESNEATSSQGAEEGKASGEGLGGKNNSGQEEKSMDYADIFKGMKLAKSYKGFQNNNPIIEQHYGADPFAMVYGDEVYFYMTADAYERDASGEIATNTYGKIRSLYVVSTKDMINFTDHGEITIAGAGGATKWAHNSWAPAAAWKEIDGKPKFFLYFADNGGGIGVVTSDSPVGPFVDELGHGLIRRDMENCGNVEWLFDPAVLVDDDGKAYIYFGGGVPQGKASHPMTARCAQLGDDMMSLVDVPKTIDAPYLFEDSGIHKFGDTYYYTYCSNFSVDKAGTDEWGMENGEICVMESKNPLGPFTYKERILKNPGFYFGVGGNNHHAVFKFKDQWYITYHTRILETAQEIVKGYRSTSIDEITIAEDGTIGNVRMTKDGRSQVGSLNPYEAINGATFAVMGGVDTAPADETSKKYGCGNLLLTDINDGDFVKLQGVDFGDKGATVLKAKVKTNGKDGVIRMTNDFLNPGFTAYLPVKADGNEATTCEVKFDEPITGKQDVYFTFSGEGYEILEWIFE